MLKAELHSHTSEDKTETAIRHSAKELIDHCAEQGYEVLAITLHERLMFSKELEEHARSKGVLLIPAYEPRLDGKDILVYNVGQADIQDIKGIDDLYGLKERKKDVLIIAAHPYFMKSYCLKNLLVKHIKLFDAIEYSHFYINGINFNRKAVRTARKYGKPLVGTSDIHFISQLGHTYTMIDAEKNAGAVIEAIKKGNLRVITRALPLKTFLGVLLWSTRETLKAVLGLK